MTGRGIKRHRSHQAGFTLVEMMIVVCIIGVLVAISIPLYANMTASARVAKAQADVRGLASAVTAYFTHMSTMPSGLDELTAVAINAQNVPAGPFMGAIPAPPNTTWGSSYAFMTATDGLFTISAAGDGRTVSAP